MDARLGYSNDSTRTTWERGAVMTTAEGLEESSVRVTVQRLSPNYNNLNWLSRVATSDPAVDGILRETSD